MRAVKRRPPQAVSQLPPSPYNEHPTSARNKECGPVTTEMSTDQQALYDLFNLHRWAPRPTT